MREKNNWKLCVIREDNTDERLWVKGLLRNFEKYWITSLVLPNNLEREIISYFTIKYKSSVITLIEEKAVDTILSFLPVDKMLLSCVYKMFV